MLRSFTDRVLGGVCGGIAAAVRVNTWIVRAAFVALAIASLGAFAALYLILWWVMPQESLYARKRGGLPFPLLLVFIALTVALWLGRDAAWLRAPGGESLYLPLLALVLALVFFLRQVRA
ncbi:MAG: PspC domain-containing protein [Chloroflexota bacterium]|nr:PspC domain-containing protein [Chloroflexota bacterium]